jgi:4-hydroxy-2-oxoheptanedioate aldolase
MEMANKLKNAWGEGRVTTNGWLMIPHVVAVDVMAAQGWDSITLDMQHGFVDPPDLVNLLAALGNRGPAGPVPLVRVPWNDPGIIYRVLDAGAQGIICPMVNTASEAEALVAATKYPPLGGRSFGPVRMLLTQGPQYVTNANASCLAIAQIETRQALENLDAILAVKGLDAIYVGPSDLALDMGFPPHLDTEQPALLEAFDKIVAAAKKHGVAAAMHNTMPAYAKKMAARGFNMVTFGSDVGFMLAAGQAAMATYKGAGSATTAGGY